MRAISIEETMSVADGLVQIAFDLSGSSAGYLIVTIPEDSRDTEIDFFGHDHYVELKDQLFGRYGGLSSINLQEADKLEIRLNYDVPEIGNSISIVTKKPVDGRIWAQLQRLKGAI